MQKSASEEACVQITVYDVHGLGGGASGAAAGLLHPFSPKGKLTWLGMEGLSASVSLIKAAEAADPRLKQQNTRKHVEPVAVWNGILRIGGHARQSWELTQFLEQVQTLTQSWLSDIITCRCCYTLMYRCRFSAVPSSCHKCTHN